MIVADHLVTTIVEAEATHEAAIAILAIGTAAEMAIVVATVAVIVVVIVVTVIAPMATAAEARAMVAVDVVTIVTAMLVAIPVAAAAAAATAIVSQLAIMVDLHHIDLPMRNVVRASVLVDRASNSTRKHITFPLTMTKQWL